VKPILHISFPVHDMSEAVAFYRRVLGAEIGRQADTFTDALLFGAQITLQNDPSNVTVPMPRSRHFGATLSWPEWESLASKYADDPCVVERPKIAYEGQPIEEGKMMLKDPSGNLIEIKAYRHPDKVLGLLATG
jgi:extradiol dioxygenase family protein